MADAKPMLARIAAAIDDDLERQADIQTGCDYWRTDECGVAAANMNIVTSELASAIYLAMEAARQPPLPSDDGLIKALEAVEPYLDAIVCYASTMDEHEPNRIAHQVREALSRHKAPLSEIQCNKVSKPL